MILFKYCLQLKTHISWFVSSPSTDKRSFFVSIGGWGSDFIFLVDMFKEISQKKCLFLQFKNIINCLFLLLCKFYA